MRRRAKNASAERTRSNTPLQALVLLNDPSYVEAARALAALAARQPGGLDAQIRWAHRRTLADEPDDNTFAVLRNLYDRHLAQYRGEPDAAARAHPDRSATPGERHRCGPSRGAHLGVPCAAQPARDGDAIVSIDDSSRALTRRTFLGRGLLGLGSLALGSLLDPRAFAAMPPPQRKRWTGVVEPAPFRAARQARDPSLHGRRAVAVRDLRLQAEAGGDERPTDARIVHQGAAHRAAPEPAADVPGAAVRASSVTAPRARRSATLFPHTAKVADDDLHHPLGCRPSRSTTIRRTSS